MSDGKSFPALRKNKSLLLRTSFALIMAGFALGYIGGVNGSALLTAGAFTLWGAAGAMALLVKS